MHGCCSKRTGLKTLFWCSEAELTAFPEEQFDGLLYTAEEALRQQREEQVRELQAEVEELVAQSKYEEAIALVEREGTDTPLLQSLLARREARDRDQLFAIEQRIPATKKSRLKWLAAQAERISDPYTTYLRITVIVSRIGEWIARILHASKLPSKPLPKRWILSSIAVTLCIGSRVRSERNRLRLVALRSVPIHREPQWSWPISHACPPIVAST